ncbi:cytochrome c biogenesis protein CcdA [Methanogenium marinum]|uniref:Cytochrome c biogenesis protein CcdA n=1 Tax=Methanogenium marinum TaxID=348610 RepID=A0A9Q4KU70_9EURY|nr:cytochrome c biogenesis protein CcdA [Methanogenium marinum]MDE4908122.1 cytochrome c biogenesis protein CcdA [Methanogenium marinum]
MTASFLLSWPLSFLAGVLTPLGAVCVLPLYPGYLAFLAGQCAAGTRARPLYLGLCVTGGVLAASLLFGFIVITLFGLSADDVTFVISPLLFGVLAVVGVLMIVGLDFSRILPHIAVPGAASPYTAAVLFGLFFGLIALPCNPAGIVVLFALSATVTAFLDNFVNFIFFGFGMALPLLLLSLLSEERTRRVTGFLTHRAVPIRIGSGIFMLAVSLYYLFLVFHIAG